MLMPLGRVTGMVNGMVTGMITGMVTGMVTQISLCLMDSRWWQYCTVWRTRLSSEVADRKLKKITQSETFL